MAGSSGFPAIPKLIRRFSLSSAIFPLVFLPEISVQMFGVFAMLTGDRLPPPNAWGVGRTRMDALVLSTSDGSALVVFSQTPLCRRRYHIASNNRDMLGAIPIMSIRLGEGS